MTIKDRREQIRQELYGYAKQLEVLVTRARESGSAEQRELTVRMGKRALAAIERRLAELKKVGEPAPWVTAPTPERTAQAGEAPVKTVTTQDGQPDGINHRWLWPVETLHRKWLATPDELISAQRLNHAFHRLGKKPGTMDYDGAMRAVDPARRLPMTREQQGAWAEFEFVMRRLTDKERRVAWALVIQEPMPGEAEALKPQVFVQRFWQVAGNSDARHIGYGMLMCLIDRLHQIYKRFDFEQAHAKAEARETMKREHAQHVARVPNTRVKLPTQ